MTTSFDPANKAADVTLTGSNLILTKTANSDDGARCVDSFTTGRWHIEYVPGSTGVGNVLGFVTSAYTGTGYPGQTATSVGLVDSGDVRINNANVGSAARCGAVGAGGRMRAWIDWRAGQGRIWFQNDNNNINGVAGCVPGDGNGISITGLGTPGTTALFPAVSIFSSGRTGTLKPLVSDWTGTIYPGWAELNGVSAVGPTITTTLSIVAGAATAGVNITGPTLTTSLSLLAGAATAGVSLNGSIIVATLSILPGAASGSGGASVSGATIVSTLSIIAGTASTFSPPTPVPPYEYPKLPIYLEGRKRGIFRRLPRIPRPPWAI